MKENTPIRIGSHTLPNRITFAPTVKFDYTDDSGKVTEKHIKHYTNRAKGGCGLICVEATAVTPGGRFVKTHMGLWSDEQIEGHKAITQGCHRYGSVVIIQLNHTGYQANPECGPAIGPSQIEWKRYDATIQTVEMSVAQIHEMQKSFVDAAVRAKEAGYDGVQLHGCHSYLINQFMSPVTNHRQDAYGGDVRGRARFGCEIIREIRRLCGPDFLISVRTSGYDPDLAGAIAVAEEYVKAGSDYLQVSNGLTPLDSLPPYPDEKISDIQSLGVYFHEHFAGRVPVSCVGGLMNAEQIAYLLDKDYVDTVDVARAILADPAFAHAVLNHTEFTRCYACPACQYGPGMAHTCPAKLVRQRKPL